MASKGERNNNPGNLEASPWTRSQPGYVGSDGRFAIFQTMQDGIAAQGKLLEGYISRGYNTVEKIINRYGNDPGTGDDASVANYKKYVAARLGVNTNSILDRAYARVVAGVMGEFETGKTKSGTVADTPPNLGESVSSAVGGAVGAVGSALTPDWIENIFNGKNAARWTSVIVGVIFVALAIAAFILVRGDDIKGAVVKAAL